MKPKSVVRVIVEDARGICVSNDAIKPCPVKAAKAAFMNNGRFVPEKMSVDSYGVLLVRLPVCCR